MGQARAALPGQRAQGTPTSHHGFEHDEDGAGRTPAEVPASREGTGASGPARGSKGHSHCYPERTHASVRRLSFHAESSSDWPTRKWIERAVISPRAPP